MSKYITRNVLICVVPSVIVLLSVYWFRKKKKFKINSSPTETIITEDSEIKLDSMAEISSETADTLSDASSFASPESSEKSIRTKKFPLVTLPNDVGNDVHNCISSSNHVEAKAHGVDSPKLNASAVSVQFYSPISASAKPITDPAVIDSAASIAKDLISQVEQAVENMSAEYLSEIGEKVLRDNISGSRDHKTNYDEDLILNVINKMGVTTENRFTADDFPLNDVDKLIKAIETDSNDSRSSVLDENSLSYVSDDSESRQAAGSKNKGSLSSVLDENSVSSLCDDLEKSVNCESPCASLKSNVSPDIQEYPDAVKGSLGATDAIDGSKQWSDVQTLNEPATISQDLTSEGALQVLSRSVGGVPSDRREDSTREMPTSCDNSEEALQESAEGDQENGGSASCDNLSSDVRSKSCLNHTADFALEASSPDEKAALSAATAEPLVTDVDISAQLITLAPLQQQNSCDSSWSAQGSLSEVIHDTKGELLDSKVPENSAQYTYEFELPQELCGRLIGKHGKHVKSIKDRSHANVYIKRHPFDPQLKIVVVEGNRSDVKDALELIRMKYPPSQFPNVTLVKTNMMSTNILPESLQLHLPEGASCDVILSSLVSAGHFFLQQPTHPTYPSLSTLDQYMNNCYSQLDTPLLPHPVVAGVICAAPVLRGWYRAQVIYVFENGSDCELKFVDYGGFAQVCTSSLRQIRSDFMSLPFQASQCYLANVRPVDPAEGWSAEVTSTFEELAQGQILQAMLVEYASDGIPCVHLYRVQGISSMFINKELVERGLAVWVNNSHWDPH